MICFYGNQQIQFPSAIQVQSITNSLESSRVATVDIPVFQTSIIENALKANEIDKKSIPESIYKEEKMNFQYVFLSIRIIIRIARRSFIAFLIG